MDSRRRPATNGASQDLWKQMGANSEIHAWPYRQRHKK